MVAQLLLLLMYNNFQPMHSIYGLKYMYLVDAFVLFFSLVLMVQTNKCLKATTHGPCCTFIASVEVLACLAVLVHSVYFFCSSFRLYTTTQYFGQKIQYKHNSLGVASYQFCGVYKHELQVLGTFHLPFLCDGTAGRGEFLRFRIGNSSSIHP